MEFIRILETEPESCQKILRNPEILDLLERIESMAGRKDGREEEPGKAAYCTGPSVGVSETEPAENTAEETAAQ